VSIPLSPAARDAFMAEVVKSARDRVNAKRMSTPNIELRGNNLAIQTMTDSFMVTHGPAGTGKSLAWLLKGNAESWAHPNLRGLIVREVRADLAESVLATFERDILGYNNPICAGATRQNRDVYRYPNGSIIVLGGMDRPGRFLSMEWDWIYFPEMNQTTVDKARLLWSRLARDGRYANPWLGGDCNPDVPTHWLLQLAEAEEITLLQTTHKDNPKYWDAVNEDWTPLGVQYVLNRLARLPGILRQRFYEGLWVIAEGAIYDIWDEATHVKDDEWLIAHGWLAEREGVIVPGRRVVRVFGGQDWGYKNPGDLQVWLQDGDGRMLLAHEVYMTHQLTGWWVNRAQEATARWGMETLVCDPSQPAAIQEMVNGGVHAVEAINDIRDGIDRVYARLVTQGDGQPRLLVRRNALSERDPNREEKLQPCGLREEMPAQVWKDKSKKEEPADGENHAADVARYSAQEADMNRRVEIIQDNPLFG
jgi:hypothetical protein